MKQKELSIWLKGIVIVCAGFGAVMAAVLMPQFALYISYEYPIMDNIMPYWNLFIALTGIIFYIGLLYIWFICNDIAADNSFSIENSKRLKVLSRLALLEALLYMIACVIFAGISISTSSLIATDMWVLAIGIFVIFVAIIITIVMASLSHLVEKAAILKEDSDLTV